MYFRSVCLLQSFANKKWRANALAWLVFPMSQHFVFLINVSFWMRILGEQDFEIHGGLLKCKSSRHALIPMPWCRCQCPEGDALISMLRYLDEADALISMPWYLDEADASMAIPWCLENVALMTYHNGLCQYCPTLKSINVTPWVYTSFFIIQL